jgi:hypothetical protein
MQVCKLYQRLTSRVDIWAVQRVTRNDLYIRGKILIEGSQLRSLAGGLTADNRTDLGRFYTGQRASHSYQGDFHVATYRARIARLSSQ